MLRRWYLLAIWTLVACGMAGVYGAIHNQVSYTISQDYFHAFKFNQFGLSEAARNRWGASLVGVLASWWTGIVIGPALYVSASRRSDGTPSALVMWWGMGVVILVTVTCGFLAVLVGWLTTRTPADVIFAPVAAQDPVAFQRAGILHDGSYLGGIVGLIIACLRIRFASRMSSGTSQRT